MNIILTGERRIGKSFALAKALERLDCERSGFLTRFDVDRRCADRTLSMLSLDGSVRECVIRWKDEAPEVLLDVFDSLGPGLISGSGLIIMDELGKFENDAHGFQRAVEQVFDSGRALAVVRLNAVGWMQALKARPDVFVITVTLENRDSVPDQIISLLHSGKS